MVSAFYFQKTMGGYVFSVQGTRTLIVVDLVQMLLPGHMALGTRDVEVNAKINLKRQSIYKHPTHLHVDPSCHKLSVKHKYHLGYLRK